MNSARPRIVTVATGMSPMGEDRAAAASIAIHTFLDACRRFDGRLVHAMMLDYCRDASTPGNAATWSLVALEWSRKDVDMVLGLWDIDGNDVIVASAQAEDHGGTIVWVRGPDRTQRPFLVERVNGIDLVGVMPIVQLTADQSRRLLGYVEEAPPIH